MFLSLIVTKRLLCVICLTFIMFPSILSREFVYTYQKCANRFEYRNELKEMALGCNDTKCTCQHLQSTNPQCGINLTISYGNFPPYVFKDHDGTVEGILPRLLKNALDSCCFGCNSINFIGPYNHLERFFVEQADIAIPVFTSTQTKTFFGHDYVHILDVKVVTFLGPPVKHDPAQMGAILINSVWSTWPLFCTAFIMAATAGIAIWILDTKFNESEFPITFPRGPFEGFWWAFVSMTTVGYGDRSPKSTMARLFAVVWILIGITIFSMYTASLSSALTSSAISIHENTLRHKKIGVLNLSTAGYIGTIQKNSVAIGFETLDEITHAILYNEVDGMAVDENEAIYYAHELKETKIKELTIYSTQEISGVSYGMVSYTKQSTDLFGTFFESNEDHMDIMTKMALKEIADTYNINAALSSKGDIAFFASNSPLFYISVCSLIGIAIITTIIGLIIKHVSHRYNTTQKDDNRTNISKHGLLTDQRICMDHIMTLLQESENLMKILKIKYGNCNGHGDCNNHILEMKECETRKESSEVKYRSIR